MTYSNKIPGDLNPLDRLGDMFRGNYSYEYSNLVLLHSEISNDIFRCLAFDVIYNLPSYLEVDLESILALRPLVNRKSFDDSEFDLEGSNSLFELDYNSLFKLDLFSPDLVYNDYLFHHMFGFYDSSFTIHDYSNNAPRVDVRRFNYSGTQFYRFEKTYHTKRNKRLVTNEFRG